MRKHRGNYDRLTEHWNTLEATHEKIILKKKFKWFDNFALSIIKDFASNNNLHFEIKKTCHDITVLLSGNKLLIVDDYIFIRKLIGKTDVCYITRENDELFIKLWFRCWKWIRKDSLLYIILYRNYLK
ncbi:MAG: hypothetical protein ACRDBO_16600 [Lachnospiraceae bacterium]